ncbi:50S ribosomal protein L6 [Desulforhopalus singaporensis]|uniref:Large ribosomal subunit protein uL6 n=1 Tax=Desulforhopalus singaporensis TaxID=91360 RepID=A0A1H0RBB7_9BACT|nr:50S ribosomal protein L6 [Desulforhopalus singaporensis]SDP26892.1 large subunit ribosomal protein L6 [Desulforhopalus singaporensis]
MSRIGKQPIPVPAGVTVDLKGQQITVKGTKGTLQRQIVDEIEVVLGDGVIEVKNREESTRVNAFRGMSRSLINNMVVGVAEGFKKVLVIEGVGYKASASGSKLTLNVGYSNPVDFEVPKEVAASVEGNNKIVLESIDKELVGLVAAKIRQIRKPEPYKGKGIRYEDEHIVRKVGKAGGA